MHLSYIFSKELLLYFEKWNFFKKLLLFQEATFQAEKKKKSLKKFLIFQEMELSGPKILIKLFYTCWR